MRIKNRDLILEFLGKCYENESRGATTSDISKTLQMQRTNVSKLLNELCAEGLVEKDSTNYPVIYRRTKMGKSREAQIFETLIGYDGSLKRAVHLAKSAVLYPKKSLNMLLLAKHGTGKDLFISKPTPWIPNYLPSKYIALPEQRVIHCDELPDFVPKYRLYRIS